MELLMGVKKEKKEGKNSSPSQGGRFFSQQKKEEGEGRASQEGEKGRRVKLFSLPGGLFL